MSEQADIVRAYIAGLTEHRPSDVEEAVALTALEQLRRERDDFEQRLHAYKSGEIAGCADDMVLGCCPHGVNLDREFCPEGCRV